MAMHHRVVSTFQLKIMGYVNGTERSLLTHIVLSGGHQLLAESTALELILLFNDFKGINHTKSCCVAVNYLKAHGRCTMLADMSMSLPVSSSSRSPIQNY